jgi:hypothetical protein
MTTIHNIELIDSMGVTSIAHIEASEQAPWELRYSTPNQGQRIYGGRDLYEALQNLRQDLEPEGVRILCAGARTDVAPSGMGRSMGGGRKVYILKIGQQATSDLVDIFDPAEPDLIGTVEEQRAYFERWSQYFQDRL